jgi:phosphoserine phosphatase
MSKMIEMVVFDLDGVLLVHSSSWQIVLDHFGVSHYADLKKYIDRKIDYPEFMRRAIALWPKGTSLNDLEAILSDFKLMPGASELFEILKTAGIKTAIVSAGIDILAKKVGEILGADYVFANGFEIDRNGNLTGEGIPRVGMKEKDKVLKLISDKVNISLEKFLAVGDSSDDIAMFKECGYSIAFNSRDQLVKEAANAIIDTGNLLEVNNYIKEVECQK